MFNTFSVGNETVCIFVFVISQVFIINSSSNCTNFTSLQLDNQTSSYQDNPECDYFFVTNVNIETWFESEESIVDGTCFHSDFFLSLDVSASNVIGHDDMCYLPSTSNFVKTNPLCIDHFHVLCHLILPIYNEGGTFYCQVSSEFSIERTNIELHFYLIAFLCFSWKVLNFPTDYNAYCIMQQDFLLLQGGKWEERHSLIHSSI